MREFRPPIRPSKVPAILAAVFSAILLGTTLPLARMALGPMQVTYTVADGTLTVRTGGMDGSRTIPLSKIQARREIDLRGGRRTRGTYLPGYCTGRWTFDAAGAAWTAGNCAPRGVQIFAEGEDLPIVLTPPDPDGFVRDLAAEKPMRVELRPVDMGGLRALFLGAIVLALVADAMIVRTFLYGPRRMRYLVGGGFLEVRTVFGRKRWALAGATARPHAARLALKLAGSAFRGYYTGLFRESGATTRVYATDLAAGVLVEGPARVFLSPEDRAGFLDALRAEGARVDAAPAA